MMTPYTRKRQRRRAFVVRVGVYFAVVAGVLTQWTVTRFDARDLTIDLQMDGFSIGRVIVAMIVAMMVYRQIDGKGEMAGKVAHIDRALTLGFTSGFTLMGVVGIGD